MAVEPVRGEHLVPVVHDAAPAPAVAAAAGPGRAGDSLAEAMLGWMLGVAAVYGALFGTGSFLYGNTAQGIMWAVVFIVSVVGLIRILPKMTSGAGDTTDPSAATGVN